MRFGEHVGCHNVHMNREAEKTDIEFVNLLAHLFISH
jgi:hypothetical protein